jgi:transcriptional regulator with XRE-family HTH domain
MAQSAVLAKTASDCVLPARLSQADIATLMGSKPPAVTRQASSLGNSKHSPSLATLQKYAQAIGYQLQIKQVRT